MSESVEKPEANEPFPLEIIPVGGSLTALDVSSLRTRLEEVGGLLLRGATPDVHAFRSFAERLCSTSVFNESANRETIDFDSNIQTVDLGEDSFPLHPELSREPWRPDVAMFHCIEAPPEGGETTVCDGVGIVERLPPELVKVMAERKILYIRPSHPNELAYWLGTENPSDEQLQSPPPGCPYQFRRARGLVLRIFARDLLHRPMFDDRLAFGNFLLFARDKLRKPMVPCLDDGSPVPDEWLSEVRRAAAPITFGIKWQDGDLAILDNSRFMHGRNSVIDPSLRKIASYFGYLPDAPPSEDEPSNPIWRRQEFRPPRPPRARPGRPVAGVTTQS